MPASVCNIVLCKYCNGVTVGAKFGMFILRYNIGAGKALAPRCYQVKITVWIVVGMCVLCSSCTDGMHERYVLCAVAARKLASQDRINSYGIMAPPGPHVSVLNRLHQLHQHDQQQQHLGSRHDHKVFACLAQSVGRCSLQLMNTQACSW